MQELFSLVVLFGILWCIFWGLKKIWPALKFGLIFLVAALGFGSWFVIKEVSPIGTIIGLIAVVVGAYRYAKNKMG